jgi:hypothetical protein
VFTVKKLAKIRYSATNATITNRIRYTCSTLLPPSTTADRFSIAGNALICHIAPISLP